MYRQPMINLFLTFKMGATPLLACLGKLMILFILLTGFSAQAQQGKKTDSVEANQNSIYALLDSIRRLSNHDLKRTWELVKEVETLSKNSSDVETGARANAIVGAMLSTLPGDSIKLAAVPYIKTSISLFRKLGDSTGVQKNFNNLSALYSRLQDHKLSLDYALKAFQLARYLHQTKENYQILGLSHLNLGYSYELLKLHDSSEHHYRKATRFLERIEHPLRFRAKSNLVSVHTNKGELDQAKDLLLELYAATKQNSMDVTHQQISYSLGLIYMELKDFSEAIPYLRNTDKLGYKKYDAMAEIAASFLQLQQIDSSEKYVNALEVLPEKERSLEVNIKMNDLKGKILDAQGQEQSALRFYREAALLKDSFESRKNSTDATQLLIKSKDSTDRAVLDQQRALTLSSKKRFWGTTTLFLLLTSFMVVFFWKQREKQRFLKENLEHQLIREKEQKEQLNREITVSSANLARKNEVLSQVHQSLQSIKTANRELQLRGVMSRTQELVKDSLYQEELWSTFFKHFTTVFPQFNETLVQQYSVSPHELKICCFIKMNLSYKEIAHVLNISPASVKQSIYRLKKKLQLPKEQSVFVFLHSL